MKKSEFKALIRESVREALNEGSSNLFISHPKKTTDDAKSLAKKHGAKIGKIVGGWSDSTKKKWDPVKATLIVNDTKYDTVADAFKKAGWKVDTGE